MNPGNMELLDVLRGILELGWPALVTIFLVVLWRKLEAIDSQLHDCLGNEEEEKKIS